MYDAQYKKKLMSAEQAVQLIDKKCNIAFGMAVSQPPALLAAIANRAKAKDFDEIKVYYMHAEEPANNTILQYELMDIIKPYPGFLGSKERALIKQGDIDGNCKVIFYVPNSFSHLPRYFRNYIQLDACVVTVSPMDKSGYFTFGTNNDYTSTAAKTAAKLIPDGATIQMGVGGVPDAVCNYLMQHNDLGIHSELLSPGMVELIKKG